MGDKYNQSETKRFYLGDSDSEDDSEWGSPNQRRFSMSASECSGDDVVGGVPTNLNFDEDSGLGLSMEGSERDSVDSNDCGLVPLRHVNIGKSASKTEQQRTRRAKRYHFNDFYELSSDHLGAGAYASVSTCISRETGQEFAVKMVNKHEPGHTRSRILREVDVFKMCRNHPNIVQLVEWFEDENRYFLVFEKMQGGPLLSQIQNKVCFNEQEAAQVAKDIANALKFLHSKGVAHRDLKPENVLCVSSDRVSPVKLCDLDLASKPTSRSMRRASRQLHNVQSEPDLSSPVGSAEFLAPEVVETFVGEALKYNRQCDMWSLGVIVYIMLCGYVPFYGECEKAEFCGWNQGQPCDDCQEDLFEKIRIGEFDYPESEWNNISDDAKDLISHLLVKDVRKRYTADDVLKHSWIANAPETPLHTANNLFRNNSSKDIQIYNDHFNLNHFTNRLSSQLEETIPSLGSTPPDSDSHLDNIQQNNIGVEASKLLEAQMPPTAYYYNDLAAMNPMHYPPAPMINMNGVMIYAPQMAQNTQMLQNQPPYFAQQQQQQFYYPDSMNYMSPHQPLNATNMTSTEEPLKCHKGVFECRANPQGGLQRSRTPNGNINQLDNIDVKNLQQHRGSLATAISQLGLETCQNAMVRQGSAGQDLHQTRETQVNV